MINQEFKAQRRKFQVLPNFGTFFRGVGGGGLKLPVFAHACEVSTLPMVTIKG